MSDFFFRLAARSFGHAKSAEPIRPRLPSLFEPETKKRHDVAEDPAGPDGSAAFEKIQEDGSWSAASAAPVPERIHARNRKELPGPWVRQPENDEKRPLDPVGDIPTSPDRAAAIENDPLGKPRVQQESRGNEPVQYGSKGPTPPAFASPPQTETLGRMEEKPKFLPFSAVPHTRSDQGERFEAVTHQLTEKLQKPSKPAATTPVAVEDVRLVEQVQEIDDHESAPANKKWADRKSEPVRSEVRIGGALFHPGRETAPPKPLEPPVPTINVTIGRIEVRAVTAGKAEKRRPAPKAMSLDEYLARRTGGRS